MLNQKLLGSVSSLPSDANFENVSLLLNGDGTNGAQNNTFLDSSTNNFTITRNGNTTQGSFSPYGSNWSNYFNGSSRLNVSSNAALQMGSGNYTIESWVNFSSLGNSGAQTTICQKGRSGAGNEEYGFYIIQTGGSYYLRLEVSTTGSNSIDYDSSAIPNPLNTWNHCAVSVSGSTAYFWFNGVAYGTATVSNSLYIGTADFSIGSNNAGTDGVANGYISNFRIVKGSAVYTASFTPSTTPLTAISGTSLLTCQSNRFIDNSSNNFTLTRNGSPSVQRFSPFNPTAPYSTSVIGGSGYWNGSGDYLSASANAAWASGTSDFTYEAWVFQTNTSATLQSIVNFRDGNINNFEIRIDGTQPQLHWDGALIYNGSSNLIAGQWNHLAISRSSGTLRMYLNGNSIASTTTSYNFNQNTTAYFGGYGGGGSGWAFYGYMAGVRFVNGTAIYSGTTYTIPTTPPTAVTNTKALLNFTNAGIKDFAMQNDLQTVGNAQVSTSVKKYGTGSIYMDGTSGTVCKMPYTTTLGNFGTNDFTIEGWVYPLSTVNYTAFISSNNSGTPAGGWVFGMDVFDLGFLVGGTFYLSTSFSSYLNTWTYITLVRQSGTIRLYINGVQQTNTTLTTNLTGDSTNSIVMGKRWVDTDEYFYNGYIDDFRVTKGICRYPNGTTFTPPASALPTL